MRKIKFSSINRRHLTLIGLIVVIAIAGYINVNHEGDIVETIATVKEEDKNVAENVDVNTDNNDAYTLAVMERDSKRSQSMSVYRDIIDNSNCDKQTKENAQTMLSNAAKYINDENTIESTIKAKGIEKNVVYIGEDDVTVLVYGTKLTELQVVQIKDIVAEKTKIAPDKIKIIENK